MSEGFAKWLDNYLDLSSLDFEVTTRIPKDRLVNIISDFYWDMGHDYIGIRFFESGNERCYIHYKPDFQLGEGDTINEILVSTRKGKNKQKFDSIYFTFEDDFFEKNKIIGHFAVGYKIYHLIYFLITLGISFWYSGQLYATGKMAAYLNLLLLIPLFIVVDRYRLLRLAKLPSAASYKKEFEEHIRLKEKELFP